MIHVRIFVTVFGSFKFCAWASNVSNDIAQLLAGAVMGLNSHGVPISIEETPAP